ncbi:MAG: hypothetical protein HY952_03380 [Elusimicrobia bacterium]|nr:hypothetical protein [Elusimicrobiota bacterium]
MAQKKTYRVRVRGKVRNQLLRRGAAVAGATLGLLAASWFFGAAFKASKNFTASRLFSFKPASFEVDCPAPAAAEYARGLAAGTLNLPLTAARCAELAQDLRDRHPGLLSVDVARNFITGKLSLKAVPEELVSPVLLAGTTAYLGVTGRFLPEALAEIQGPRVPASVGWRAEKAPELAGFLKELNQFSSLFYSVPAGLDCPGRDWACRLTLADGTVVLWGGFEFTRLKILRLNEVVRDAAARNGAALRVDMRYFKEGKIFVSPAAKGG